MRYLRWTGGAPVASAPLLASLLVEYDDDGHAIREIGLDRGGQIIHRYPSEQHRFGDFGLLADGFPTVVDQDARSGFAGEITEQVFDNEWNRPNTQPPIEHQVKPAWRERLRRLRHPWSR